MRYGLSEGLSADFDPEGIQRCAFSQLKTSLDPMPLELGSVDSRQTVPGDLSHYISRCRSVYRDQCMLITMILSENGDLRDFACNRRSKEGPTYGIAKLITMVLGITLTRPKH